MRFGCGESCPDGTPYERKTTCPVALSDELGAVATHTFLRRVDGAWRATEAYLSGSDSSLSGKYLLGISLGRVSVSDTDKMFPLPGR